ncbi:hypothetical protein HZY62_01520 [Maribacter polysiphoniae]|nr:hypothetical protein [Maribacter polysiphoniae]MBD1259252.1 hypothetical protein [Maribacter polysiphoniae]
MKSGSYPITHYYQPTIVPSVLTTLQVPTHKSNSWWIVIQQAHLPFWTNTGLTQKNIKQMDKKYLGSPIGYNVE